MNLSLAYPASPLATLGVSMNGDMTGGAAVSEVAKRLDSRIGVLMPLASPSI